MSMCLPENSAKSTESSLSVFATIVIISYLSLIIIIHLPPLDSKLPQARDLLSPSQAPGT